MSGSTHSTADNAPQTPDSLPVAAQPSECSGILNLHKPQGLTSHDVVAQIRRLSHERRVGHAGTLDPLATGVLLVCLGRATRIIEYLSEMRKTYLATLRWGIVTDTWDAEGQVIETRDTSALTRAQFEQILPRFRGPLEQVPPMYSALKRGGQPLYRLARQGLNVERAPRPVEIYALDVVRWQPPEVVLRVECSKGTYIRSLAYDLGEALGVGAHLAQLTRLAVGPFKLEEAVSLETLWSEQAGGRWQRHLLPMRTALGDMPGLAVDLETAQRLSYGQAVALDLFKEAELCYTYRKDGFLAIVKREPGQERWRPVKVLVSA